jgi:hypothetical protein
MSARRSSSPRPDEGSDDQRRLSELKTPPPVACLTSDKPHRGHARCRRRVIPSPAGIKVPKAARCSDLAPTTTSVATAGSARFARIRRSNDPARGPSRVVGAAQSLEKVERGQLVSQVLPRDIPIETQQLREGIAGCADLESGGFVEPPETFEV